ncbi:MAG: hypothetical protein ACE5I1_13325 [bacterium]
MPIHKPTFTLSIGSLTSSTDNPLAGPVKFLVERDMDVAADGLVVWLRERAEITPGDEVSLNLGHDNEQETVFSGNVVEVRPSITGVGIRILGKQNALLKLRISAFYENQSCGAIARDFISKAGLSAGEISDGPTLSRFAVDNRRSAYAHLKGLGDRLGYELYTDRFGKMMFHALGPAAGLDTIGGLASLAGGLISEGAEQYTFGQHVIEAQTRKSQPAFGKIAVGGESPMSGQGDATSHWLSTNDTDYSGTAGDGSPTLWLRDAAARTKDIADRFAKGHLAIAEQRVYEIGIIVMGRPQVDLGESVSSSDLPDVLLNGQGYVRAIRHRFNSNSGFTTDLKISVPVAA